MRILHLTSHLEIGGITTYVVTLAKALTTRGHDVIVASDDGVWAAQLARERIAHWPVPLHTKTELSPRVAWTYWQLSRRLAGQPVDLLHAQTRVAQVVAHGLSRRHRIPYVTTWHGFYRHERLGRRWWPCTGDVAIAISEQVRRHLVEQFHQPAARTRLIYHGIDVERVAEAPNAEVLEACRLRWGLKGRRVVGSIGRLASGGVKGLDLVLAAIQRLQAQGLDVDVLLVGDGPRRAFLEAEAVRLGIRERVHFLGATDDVRLPLALMDAFVFSSRWPEAFGLSLVEAMAVGKPVVATRTGAVPEIVQHGVNGWIVPPDDPEALTEGIARLLQDPELAARLGRQARAHAQEKFRLERMVDQVEAVYRELV